MSNPPSNPSVSLYSAGGGTASSSQFPSSPVMQTRDPATSDIKGQFGQFPVGQQWINQSSGSVYSLASFSSSNGLVTATWVSLGGGSTALSTLNGDTGSAIPSGGAITLAGTTNQITTTASGSTVAFSVPVSFIAPGAITATSTITAGTTVTATTSISSGTFITSGTYLSATTSVVAGTDVNATNGNFIAGTSGKGILLTSPSASGAAASPVVVNGRSGRATFTSVSIPATFDITLTLTNSSITSSSTIVLISMSGATSGSALGIKSKTASAGSLAIVITNGSGETTSSADIQIDFLVVN